MGINRRKLSHLGKSPDSPEAAPDTRQMGQPPRGLCLPPGDLGAHHALSHRSQGLLLPFGNECRALGLRRVAHCPSCNTEQSHIASSFRFTHKAGGEPPACPMAERRLMAHGRWRFLFQAIMPVERIRRGLHKLLHPCSSAAPPPTSWVGHSLPFPSFSASWEGPSTPLQRAPVAQHEYKEEDGSPVSQQLSYPS